MNTHFLDLLKRMEEIHRKKSLDYTTDIDSNPFENFERANIIASWFPDEYKSFAVLIGTKLARLGAMLTKQEDARKSGLPYNPQNEPIDDTFLDQTTYSAIAYSFYKKRNSPVEKPELQYDLPLSKQAGVQGAYTQGACQHHLLNAGLKCIHCNHQFSVIAADSYHWDSSTNLYVKSK